MWIRALLVAAGGALGSSLRYALTGYLGRHFPQFPWGTFVVNVVGSFLLGWLVGTTATGRFLLSPATRGFLTMGLLGGFTTFSTFSYETVAAFRVGNFRQAIGMLAGQLLCGLVACFLGLSLGERS